MQYNPRLKSRSTALISVLVPNYNQGAQLDQTLSLLERTVLDNGLETHLQIIVSDNASTDGSQGVVERYSQVFETILGTENIGLLGNLKRLLDRALGDYVWFLGSGELFQPERLVDLLSLLESEFKPAVITFPAVEFGPDSDPNSLFCSPIGSGSLLRGGAPYSVAISAMMFDRNRLARALQTEPKFGSDWPHVEYALCILAEQPAPQTAHYNLPLVYVYQEPDGWWTTARAYRYLSSLRAITSSALRNPDLSLHHDFLIGDNDNEAHYLVLWLYRIRLTAERPTLREIRMLVAGVKSLRWKVLAFTVGVCIPRSGLKVIGRILRTKKTESTSN